MTMMSHHVAEETEAEAERAKEEDAHAVAATGASEEAEPSKSTTDKVHEVEATAAPEPAENHIESNSNGTTSTTSSSDPQKSTSPSNSHNANHATSEAAPFSQVFALLGDTPGAELTRPELRCRQYGATAKGKTQDDQNVGKRQKKKKVSQSFQKNKNNNIGRFIYLFFSFFFFIKRINKYKLTMCIIFILC